MTKYNFAILALLCATLPLQSMNLFSSLTARCKRSRAEKQEQTDSDKHTKSAISLFHAEVKKQQQAEMARRADAQYERSLECLMARSGDPLEIREGGHQRPERCSLKAVLLTTLGLTAFFGGAYAAHTAIVAENQRIAQQRQIKYQQEYSRIMNIRLACQIDPTYCYMMGGFDGGL